MVNTILVIGLQVVSFFLLFLLLRKRLERTLNPEELGGKVKEELTSIMVELNRTTDQNIGLLEDKIGELKGLVEKAEKRIALLKREAERRDASQNVYRQITQSKQPPEEKEKRSVQEEVVRLHREGFSAAVIAGHLGKTIGEVELIISLERRKS
jgi:regulator of replication initiation timing